MSDYRRIAAAKLLGVHFTQNLTFSQHVDTVVTTCNQRLYLLAQLKRQWLELRALHSVFNAIVVSKILYALPVEMERSGQKMRRVWAERWTGATVYAVPKH